MLNNTDTKKHPQAKQAEKPIEVIDGYELGEVIGTGNYAK